MTTPTSAPAIPETALERFRRELREEATVARFGATEAARRAAAWRAAELQRTLNRLALDLPAEGSA